MSRTRLRAGIILLFVVLAACNSSEADETTTTAIAETSTTDSGPGAMTTDPIPTTTTTVETTTTTTATEDTTITAVNPSPPTTKVDPAPPDNQPPLVEIVSPAHLSSHQAKLIEEENRFGATVSLAAVVSDPDGDEFTVEWFSSDEGFLGTGESLIVVLHTGQFDAAQPHITARATDQWGVVSEDVVQIVVWIPSDI